MNFRPRKRGTGPRVPSRRQQMAHLNRIEATDVHTTRTAANDDGVANAERQRASFSGLEWSVIALAKGDSIASLKEPGRIAKALGALFGNWEHTRLADGRLEQLRRLAVLAWHRGWAIPLSELRAFKE